MLLDEKSKNLKTKINYLGNEPRFKDEKKSKSLSKTSVPGVGKYNMIAEWPGI